jgi:BlaI family transcriptional regulator, penicillinase repressor
MRTKKQTLTEQELEIMKVVWQLERATVREVYEELRKQRPLAYTTVMTMMNILEQKNHLEKWREDRAFVYKATQPKSRVVTEMVQDLLDRVFNGSAEPLVLHLVNERKLSEKELQKIAKMVKDAS